MVPGDPQRTVLADVEMGAQHQAGVVHRAHELQHLVLGRRTAREHLPHLLQAGSTFLDQLVGDHRPPSLGALGVIGIRIREEARQRGVVAAQQLVEAFEGLAQQGAVEDAEPEAEISPSRPAYPSQHGAVCLFRDGQQERSTTAEVGCTRAGLVPDLLEDEPDQLLEGRVLERRPPTVGRAIR